MKKKTNFHTTNEAGVFKNVFLLLLLVSQVGKSVDNDTENQIQNDNDNNKEEEHVVNHARSKHGLL